MKTTIKIAAIAIMIGVFGITCVSAAWIADYHSSVATSTKWNQYSIECDTSDSAFENSDPDVDTRDYWSAYFDNKYIVIEETEYINVEFSDDVIQEGLYHLILKMALADPTTGGSGWGANPQNYIIGLSVDGDCYYYDDYIPAGPPCYSWSQSYPNPVCYDMGIVRIWNEEDGNHCIHFSLPSQSAGAVQINLDEIILTPA